MKLGHVVGAIVSALAVGAAACGAPTPTHTGADMDLRGMPKVGAVDERFQSYNIEMASVTGRGLLETLWRPIQCVDSPEERAGGDGSRHVRVPAPA